MKLVASFALLALSSCASVAVPQGTPAGGPPRAEPEHQISLYLGQRSLDEDLWAPTEDQAAFAIEFSQGGTPEGVGWEVGFAGSTDEGSVGIGVDFTGTTGEIYGGLRKSFGSGNVRPYVGGGLSLIKAEFEGLGVSDDDTSAAGYLHGGVEFLLGPSFLIGLDLRTLFGSDIDLFGVSGDADYVQGAVTFGWRF